MPTTKIKLYQIHDSNKIILSDGTVAMAANFNMGGYRITNVATATNATDAVNLSQVQDLIGAARAVMDYKESVFRAVDTNINIASAPATLDGAAGVNGKRYLLFGQTDQRENGIYIYNGAGNAMTRASDFDGSPEGEVSAGNVVPVEAGTYEGKLFMCITPSDNVIVGTDPIIFTRIPDLSDIIAGNGLTKTGNTLDVNVDNTTLEIAADALRIKDSGVSTAKIANGAVTAVKLNDDVVGEGLTRTAGGPLRANVGNTTQIANNKIEVKPKTGTALEATVDGLEVKVDGVTVKIENGMLVAANASTLDGDGLIVANNKLNVNVDNVTLTIENDVVKVKNSGISTAQIADGAVTAAKLNDDVAGDGLGRALGALKVNVGPGLQIQSDAVTIKLATNGGLEVNANGELKVTADIPKISSLVISDSLTGIIDGTNTSFSFSNIPYETTVEIFLNGIRLEAGYDYTLVDNNSDGNYEGFTMSYPPQVGDRLRAKYYAK
jgi:hypothetical protein